MDHWLMDKDLVSRLLFSLLQDKDHGGSRNECGTGQAGMTDDQSPNLLSIFDEDMRLVRDIRDIPEGSIGLVDINGVMTKYISWVSWGVAYYMKQLDFLNNNPNITAIIIRIDGPGGSASAIAPFLRFSARKQKPVIALCDMACSLHYWMATGVADHVMAQDTITAKYGSVGVVSSWMDFKEYYKNLGIKVQEVYPPESEHKNEIWRLLQEDEEKGKKMLIEKELTQMARKFQNSVKENRPNLKADAEGVLTGRTFGAEEALQLGMIDSIGTLEDAITMGQMLAETQNVNFI